MYHVAPCSSQTTAVITPDFMCGNHHCIWFETRTTRCPLCDRSRTDHMQKLFWGTHSLIINPGFRLGAFGNVEGLQFVQPILQNLEGTTSRFFGMCGRALDGTKQVALLAVLSKVAKRYAVSDNAQHAATEARQHFASGLSLTGRESRELLAKVVLAFFCLCLSTGLPCRYAMSQCCFMQVT